MPYFFEIRPTNILKPPFFEEKTGIALQGPGCILRHSTTKIKCGRECANHSPHKIIQKKTLKNAKEIGPLKKRKLCRDSTPAISDPRR